MAFGIERGELLVGEAAHVSKHVVAIDAQPARLPPDQFRSVPPPKVAGEVDEGDIIRAVRTEGRA